ncbi:phage head-tail connector protein [Paenibacillus graminis]|uniref:phage head-tail connector protein n=1 Tax=Paenibacillus graminis TaxID=189425 RepID=UPI002DBF2FA5|nr:phage head-tail connector protein [Paenibacillus graminis]MEC0171659.1 phage head-tail connector protein [Paenibacillus graminis]
MPEEIQKYLMRLKQLLLIPTDDTSKDSRLLFVLETIVQEIKTYCNITSIPEALDNVVLHIAEDYYRTKYPTEFEQTSPPVTSIKRGDVTTAFGAAKATVTVGSGAAFVRNYAAQLQAFRRLRW